MQNHKKGFSQYDRGAAVACADLLVEKALETICSSIGEFAATKRDISEAVYNSLGNVVDDNGAGTNPLIDYRGARVFLTAVEGALARYTPEIAANRIADHCMNDQYGHNGVLANLFNLLVMTEEVKRKATDTLGCEPLPPKDWGDSVPIGFYAEKLLPEFTAAFKEVVAVHHPYNRTLHDLDSKARRDGLEKAIETIPAALRMNFAGAKNEEHIKAAYQSLMKMGIVLGTSMLDSPLGGENKVMDGIAQLLIDYYLVNTVVAKVIS